MTRPLTGLPKAHLHLHLTGAMRHSTLVDLAGRHGIHLPAALVEEWPPTLSGADERGWFRFQRLYDTARSVLRTPADMQRLFDSIQLAGITTSMTINSTASILLSLYVLVAKSQGADLRKIKRMAHRMLTALFALLFFVMVPL